MILKKEHLWNVFLSFSFILCYYNTFQWMNYKYSVNDSYYSHGYLIPFIVAYLIYAKRDRLIKQPKPDTSGYVLCVTALVTHVFAVMADINFVSEFSILAQTQLEVAGACSGSIH